MFPAIENVETQSYTIKKQMQTAREITLKSGLYLVATPIGNLRDITLRALDILGAADIILCEDTRTSGKLLRAHNIKTPTMPYHDHSADAAREKILDKLRAGQVVVLISDAGMPLISDPGYKLVRACIDESIAVTSAPGASAALMALQLSGLPSDKFTFLGFAPHKQAGRQKLLREWKDVPSTLIIYEGASRALKMLADIDAVMGGRPVAMLRELTKIYEENVSGSAAEILVHYEEKGPPKGEVVIVISPPAIKAASEDDVLAMLRAALKTQSVKQASVSVAAQSGWRKSDLYDLALKIKDET